MHSRSYWSAALPLAAAAAATLILASEAPSGQHPSVKLCARFAAPRGSDANPGTKTRPFKTAQRLADSLRPGQTGCLRAGTYSETSDGYVLRVAAGGKAGARVTVRSAPGERAKLVGIVQIAPGSDYVTLAGLSVHGTGEMNSIKIYAGHAILDRNDITNDGHGPSCVILGNTSGTGQASSPVVRSNRFHECGDTDDGNKDHAIYASNVAGGQIVNNVFWNSAAYAVQLYPNAQGVRVAHNVV